MKSTLFRSTLCLLTLPVVVFTGCATRGYQKAVATSGSLSTAAQELQAAQGQITAATAALDRLVNQPTDDLRPAFGDYRSAVTDLEKTVTSLEQRSNELAQQRQAYLTTWDARNAEIQNADIRDRSLERQREVTEQFAQVEQGYEQARERFLPLMSDLRDIQRLLSVDLTAGGVEAVRPLLDRTRSSATSARESLVSLAREFREFSATLDPETLGTLAE